VVHPGAIPERAPYFYERMRPIEIVRRRKAACRKNTAHASRPCRPGRGSPQRDPDEWPVEMATVIGLPGPATGRQVSAGPGDASDRR
jgi:hypothetical protein